MVTLSSGVKVKSKLLPPGYAVKLNREWIAKEPKPPIEFIENIGREEANPDNPDFIAAHQDWQSKFALAMFNLGMVLGLEVTEIPDGVPAEDGAEFLALLELLGESPNTTVERRVLWVQLVAATTNEDVLAIVSLLGEQGGATETGVKAETARFRRSKK